MNVRSFWEYFKHFFTSESDNLTTDMTCIICMHILCLLLSRELALVRKIVTYQIFGLHTFDKTLTSKFLLGAFMFTTPMWIVLY